MNKNNITTFFSITLVIIVFGMSSGCLFPFGRLTKSDKSSGGGIFSARESGDEMPEEVVGTWQTGTVSGIDYRNPITGGYQDPSGTQVMYKIFPDGRYEYSSLYSQSFYNCNTKLFDYKVGYIKLDGDSLTFIPTKGKFTSQDTCNARFNYEKPANLERETYQWSVEDDEYGTKICLQNSSINGCAYKRS